MNKPPFLTTYDLLLTTLILILHSSFFTLHCHAQTWKQLNSGTNLALVSIYCPDSITCYAVGNGAIILKTSDGGANWVKQNSGATGILESVFFINKDTGFAVGIDYNGPSLGLILKTIDGGISWIKHDSLTPQLFHSVFFVNKNIGFTVGSGGIIFKTTDCGTNWQEIIYDFNDKVGYLNSVYFTDNNNGYAVGDANTGDIYGIIVRTTNGGLTWVIQDSVNQYGFTSVYFPTLDTGYVIGGQIFKSVDKGYVWNEITPLLYVSSCYFINSVIGWVVGGGGRIFKTSDGGLNWINQSIGINKILYSVFFPDKFTGYIVGENGIILKHKDKTVGLNEFNLNNDLNIFPNPVNQQTTLTYQLPAQSKVLIDVYDIIGNKITTLINEQKPAGKYNLTYNTQSLNPGLYFLKLTTSSSSTFTKFIKL